MLPTIITPSTSAAVTSVRHPSRGGERASLTGSHTQLTQHQPKSLKSRLLHFWKTRGSHPPLICHHEPLPLRQCPSEMDTICCSSLCWQPQVGISPPLPGAAQPQSRAGAQTPLLKGLCESKWLAITNDSFYSKTRDTTNLAELISVNWVAELVIAGTVRCKGTETLLILMRHLRISTINPWNLLQHTPDFKDRLQGAQC